MFGGNDARTQLLETLAGKHPEQAETFSGLGQSYSKKLWHQLTVQLLDVSKADFFQSGDHLVSLYDNFVAKVADRLNKLAVAEFGICASSQKGDAAAVLAFLDSVYATVEEDVQAKVYVNMYRARVLLDTDQKKAKELLDAGRKEIDRYTGIMDTRVQSALFRSLLQFYKTYGPAAEYFKNSMLYLTYTPLESIPKQEQQDLATDVGMAALVGKNIYNFGELLEHGVIKVLEGTPKAWLVELMLAFNSGDIDAYKKTMASKKGSEKILADNEEFLNEKIRVMALMELAFRRPADERQIQFAEVAKQCQVEADQVELLLMRSFCLKVVKGVIDEVASVVSITWVQPRVLNMGQLNTIRDRINGWSDKVSETSSYLEENARELL